MKTSTFIIQQIGDFRGEFAFEISHDDLIRVARASDLGIFVRSASN